MLLYGCNWLTKTAISGKKEWNQMNEIWRKQNIFHSIDLLSELCWNDFFEFCLFFCGIDVMNISFHSLQMVKQIME